MIFALHTVRAKIRGIATVAILILFTMSADTVVGAANNAKGNSRNEFSPPPSNRNFVAKKKRPGALNSNELSADDLGTRKAKTSNFEADDLAEQSDSQELNGNSKTVRQFHEVLDELLMEFGYDIKMGQLNGLKNVSIRKVEVSEELPKTYERYIELLIEERIRENAQVKLINCLPCRTRSSLLVDGKLKITSPSHNLGQLNTAAEQLGIDNFMDVILVYHTTHMVLAFQIFNAGTKELVWARAYNSETIKSRFQKMAVDYSQVAQSRVSTEYQPEYKFMFGLGAASIPNVSENANDRTMANLQVRASERFNNRRSDFGLLLSIMSTTASFLKEYPAADGSGTATTVDPDAETSPETKPAAFKAAFAIYGVYGHNFLGNVESYNKARHGVHIGIGPTIATGYLAGTIRAGWDVYFGRRFVTSLAVMELLPTTITLAGKTVKTPGGVGADLVLSLNL